MKRFLAFITALVISSSVYSAPLSCDLLVAYGYPKATVVVDTTRLCRIMYVVTHDNNRKTPLYSAELLLEENSSGKNKRINAFKADPDLDPLQRAELSDYDKRYDRGHMTPFEDTKKNSAAALQTFYLSNMVPQDLHLNRGLWRKLENRVRKFAANSSDGVFVITGPVYAGVPTTIGDGVAIPTSIFKVVIDRTTQQGVGYIIPNIPPKVGDTVERYTVTIADVEKAVNINFTPELQNADFKEVIGEEFINFNKP